MGLYTNLSLFEKYYDCKFYFDVRFMEIFMQLIHRGIKIIDSFFAEDRFDWEKTYWFIQARIKEIDYYLDAIWC